MNTDIGRVLNRAIVARTQWSRCRSVYNCTSIVCICSRSKYTGRFCCMKLLDFPRNYSVISGKLEISIGPESYGNGRLVTIAVRCVAWNMKSPRGPDCLPPCDTFSKWRIFEWSLFLRKFQKLDFDQFTAAILKPLIYLPQEIGMMRYIKDVNWMYIVLNIFKYNLSEIIIRIVGICANLTRQYICSRVDTAII